MIVDFGEVKSKNFRAKQDNLITNAIWTWGGTETPQVDEFIVITAGQTILLDTSTPILAFLLIDGGKLMYDREEMHFFKMAAHFWLKTNWQSVENLASHFPSTPLLWSIFLWPFFFTYICISYIQHIQKLIA